MLLSHYGEASQVDHREVSLWIENGSPAGFADLKP